MDKRYEAYCRPDSLFYDVAPPDAEADYPIAARPTPEGWSRWVTGDWLGFSPPDNVLPMQGWKIHASGSLAEAEAIIAACWDYCVAKGISFKFVRGESHYLIRNSKPADRGSSGKLVTIYPLDETELEAILTELGQILEGRAGPYILSDLRWGDGPLYVRYGAFTMRYRVAADGEREPAIEDDTGALVPDNRGPVFAPPSWVKLPAFLEPHLLARKSATLKELPYDVTGALHFSNAGGVYRGIDKRTGRDIVLKEGRPFAGLSPDGSDAVKRLRHEETILQRLVGIDAVPAFHDSFVIGDHHFLVRDYIEGQTVTDLLVRKMPATGASPSDTALKDYVDWAVGISEKVEAALAEIHGRGVVIGDFHPSNVLVRPDGRIAIIDWEVATLATDDLALQLGAPGFAAPPDRRGFDIDRYALACLRFYYFMPLTTLFSLHPDKAEHLAACAAELYPLPPGFLDAAVETVKGKAAEDIAAPPASGEPEAPPPWTRIDASEESWLWARDSMVKAILASATPERDDRYFPGDIAQFDPAGGGGINFAYGAAGVLYALDAVGAERQPKAEEWMIERAFRDGPTRHGFYDGLAGVAYVLDRLGRRDEARRVLDRVSAYVEGEDWATGSIDLFGGLAGIGLTFLHFAAGEDVGPMAEAARRAAAIVADRIGRIPTGTLSGGDEPYAGLTRGASGPALFMVRMFEATGDASWLDAAAVALRKDVARCTMMNGSLQVNEGWRTLPYIADGSVGIGIVLDRFLAHRPDEAFAEANRKIGLAGESVFYILSGMMFGRAGMLLYTCDNPATGSKSHHPVVTDHIRRLAWHALDFEGHLAFPGMRMLRLSMDLATGTSGVMLAWGAARHSDPIHLPFLGP